MNLFAGFILLGSIISEISSEIPEPRIIGGHEAKPHSHPYLVSLQTRFFWIRLHVCGGALLNRYWILTAAHCIRETWIIRWLPMDAILGIHDVDNYGPKSQIINIANRIPHPLYRGGGVGPHDLAMLKLKMAAIFTREIHPIKLSTNFETERKLALAGWGALRTTYFIPDLPEKLQEVELTYLPYNECDQAIEELKESDEENSLDEKIHICTGPITGGIAACSGDSGGPLVQFYATDTEASLYSTLPNNATNERIDTATNESDYIDYDEIMFKNELSHIEKEDFNKTLMTPILVGVVSWGITPCGQKGAPTVYTRVSHYLDFINKHINS